MFYMENQQLTEEDVLRLIQEAVTDPENNSLRENIIDPIISVMERPQHRNEYIEYGNKFLEANADMLAREYPTKSVSFPKKYVDNIFELFGFTLTSFTELLKAELKKVRDKSDFSTIVSTPTNIIHTIVLFYSDMIYHRKLRDSAKHQMALTIYNVMFSKYLRVYNEGVMAYTFMSLNGSWDIVKAENVMNWIGGMIDTTFGAYRTKLSVDMSIQTLVNFLNRVRNTFNQSMRHLANRYYVNLNDDNVAGKDTDMDDEYMVSGNFTKIRENLMRLIKSQDILYYNKDKLYPGISRRKNVKIDTLYEYSTGKIDNDDISKIIDLILYVFLVKDGNSIDDINSTKYISRITNFPTVVDRAIAGKPIILPYSRKYKTDKSIVISHICLVATYIMLRINDVK